MNPRTIAGGEQVIARFPQPTADVQTTVAVVADPHVSTRREGGYRLPEHSETHLRRAFADIDRRDVDGVIGLGDLSADGAPWDFDAVDRLLADLSTPFVSIPGNHDDPACLDVTYEPLPMEQFERRYAPDGSVPFVIEFGGVELVGLDSNRLRRALEAGQEAPQLAWLEEALSDLNDPFVALHHPLPGIRRWIETYDDRMDEAGVPLLWSNPEPLLDVLEAHDVSFLLSGHKHVPGFARTRSIPEVMAPATCTFPQAYLLLDVGPEGTEVTFVPVASEEERREAYLRRYEQGGTDRLYATVGAVFLSGPPVDER